MKLLKSLLATLLTAYACIAADQITATVTITNTPSDADTFTVNADARTWYASVTNAATQVATGTNATGAASNLFTHVASYPFTTLSLQRISTNGIKLTGLPGQALAVTLSAAYGTVSYSTASVTTAYAVRVPMSVESSGQRAYIASQLATALSDYSTNSVNESNVLVTNLVGRANTQTITGVKTFTGANTYANANQLFSGGVVTNATYYGTAGKLSGYLTNITGSGLTLTNVVVHGGLYSISGTDGGEAYGASASATGIESLSLGAYSVANSNYSVAIGQTAAARGTAGTAVGYGAEAYSNAVSIGWSASGVDEAIAIGFATADGYSSIAIGQAASTTHGHDYSTAIGYASATTRSNQVVLGNANTADASVTIPNIGYVVTNLVVGGTDGATIVAGLFGGLTLADGTAPTANPTNQSVLVSASGELLYRTPTTSEGAGANNRVHNRGAEVVGSGSDYSLTGTYALVDFGGTDAEFNTLPSAGTYLIQAQVMFAGATAADDLYAKLYNATDASDISNSEVFIDSTGGREQVCLSSIVTVTAAKRIQIYAKNGTAARGTVTAIYTKITYVRLY